MVDDDERQEEASSGSEEQDESGSSETEEEEEGEGGEENDDDESMEEEIIEESETEVEEEIIEESESEVLEEEIIEDENGEEMVEEEIVVEEKPPLGLAAETIPEENDDQLEQETLDQSEKGDPPSHQAEAVDNKEASEKESSERQPEWQEESEQADGPELVDAVPAAAAFAPEEEVEHVVEPDDQLEHHRGDPSEALEPSEHQMGAEATEEAYAALGEDFDVEQGENFGPPPGYFDAEDQEKDRGPPKGFPIIDILLIVAIVVLVITLVTVLPLTLMNRNKGGGTATFPPTRGPTMVPGQPTAKPTNAPGTPTAPPGAPTRPPTFPPTPGSPPTTAPAQSWTPIAGPFQGSSGSNLGVSVAMTSTAMAAGATRGAGQVITYVDGGSNTWAQAQTLTSSQTTGSAFGNDVDMNSADSSIVVGAPATRNDAQNQTVGAAHFYTLTAGVAWFPQGPLLRGDGTSEFFGWSVATSTFPYVVVGAPSSSFGSVQLRGRVYTFQYDSTANSWVSRGSGTAVVGDDASDNLGISVDISDDSSTMVAGASGHSSFTGACYIYTWSGNDWTRASKFIGSSAQENFGASVKILNSDGSFIAVGGWKYETVKGLVQVYQRQSDGSYAAYGGPIIGGVSDQIGRPNTITGSVSGGVPTVVLSTAQGSVNTYTYNTSLSKWELTAQTLNSGFSDSPALSGSPNLGKLTGGSQKDNAAVIYSLS